MLRRHFYVYENIFMKEVLCMATKVLKKAKYGSAPMGKKVVKGKKVHRNYITKEDLKANPEGPNQIPWQKYFEEKEHLRNFRNKNKEKRSQKA